MRGPSTHEAARVHHFCSAAQPRGRSRRARSSKHVEVVIVPLAGAPACRGAFEDQVVFVHLATNILGCVRPKLVIITVAACRETCSEAPLSWPSATALDL